MATRLDRLLLLLDTGSTPTVRKTAAVQLGEIQKCHPHELYHLLGRTHEYLRHRNWETRTAAGFAIEAVLSHVPEWNPREAAAAIERQNRGIKAEDNPSATIAEQDAQRIILDFERFDLEKVLLHGTPLLSSVGKEYDMDIGSMDAKERLAFQRRQLRSRLGHDLFGGDFGGDDFVQDDDLMINQPSGASSSTPMALSSSSSSSELKRKHSDEEEGEPQMVEDIASSSGLSSREKAMLKRKARMETKQKLMDRKPSRVLEMARTKSVDLMAEAEEKKVVTQQPTGSGNEAVMVESVKAEIKLSLEESEEWPFEMFCEELCQDLFDPRWEVRHGVGVGLREVLKIHGRTAGMHAFLSDQENQQRHEKWLDDVAIRLLCVFALDRFGDFVSDQVVAPVRETCAQAFGALVRYMTSPGVDRVSQALVRLADYSLWEVRHAGLLALRYLMAVRKDHVATLLPIALPVVQKGLNDEDDDVRAVAADTLLPVADNIVQLPSDQVDELIRILGASLLRLDDLTASTSSIIDLIGKLVSFTHVFTRMQKPVKQTTLSLAQLIPLLWPFFRHTITSVRRAVVKMLSTLLQNYSGEDWVVLSDALRHTFQNVLLEEYQDIAELSLTLWRCILNPTPPAVLCASSREHIASWFGMILTPIGQPFNKSFFLLASHPRELEREQLVTSSSSSSTDAKKRRSSSSSITPRRTTVFSSHSMEDLARAADVNITGYDVIIRNRLYLCSAIAMLLGKIGGSDAAQFDDITLRALESELPFQRQMAAIILEEWSQSRHTFPAHVRAKLFEVIQGDKDNLAVCGAAAAAYAATGALPDKLNDIINPIMSMIKFEENALLQRRAAVAMSKLVLTCSKRDKSPNSKIIKNIISLDPSNTITRRGAELVLEQFAVQFGANVFVVIPALWTGISSPLAEYFASDDDATNDAAVAASEQATKDVTVGLRALSVLIPFLHADLRDKILEVLVAISRVLRSESAQLRSVAASNIAIMCDAYGLPAFKYLIESIIPLLNHSGHTMRRRGASEAVHQVVFKLGFKVLPYLVFLIVPIMGRMSDADEEVRRLCTLAFAEMVKLMPLEEGVADAPGMDQALLEQKQHERKFLQQLQNPNRAEPYQLPVEINAQLRSYQQDGVNWLNFLRKYNLHGILCDDMGLGKTLQSICILASAHHDQREQLKKEAKEGKPPRTCLPSIVVCPPTVTGHWLQEIKNFAGNTLNPVLYMGSANERRQIKARLRDYDVIITSYETLRNDAESLPQHQSFLYCILDEGHVIRNPKSKITQAVKTVRAEHRLMLSGTPIQNNVLELWSLFDFLMPGFLGTSDVFNDRYGKPISASREAKCSSREQEAGALAMEALHKQVLPFLLRRMKEQVLQDLPPKIIQDYYCDLSALQKNLYEDFSVKQSKGITTEVGQFADDDNNGESSSKPLHIFQALQYLRKVCNHPLLVLTPSHSQYKSIIENAQTFDEVMGDILLISDETHLPKKPKTAAERLQWMHSLHVAPKLLALKQLLNDCGIGVQDAAVQKADESAVLLSNAPGHRALIFCQLKSMVDIVEKDLLKPMSGVSFLRLDGSVPVADRQGIVHKFNSDPSIDVLLLTTHVGSLGLNLTGADTVIFVEHDWNPQRDLQAMDRAHRIGQKRVVNVYRLITRGTLEEKIMGIQQFKLSIANSVINQENSSLKSMNTDQLLDLFHLGADSATATAASSSAAGKSDNLDAAVALGQEPAKKKQKKGKSQDGGAQAMLAGLEDLWDASQYQEEYNLDSFITSLK